MLSALTRFVWDGDVLVHEIRRSAQASGDPVVEERTYCFEDDGFEPVAHREKDEWFHYVNDPVGTPERLVDERGQVACEMRRSTWGKVEVDEEARASTPIRFQGQYEDEETGLCYNRFRYYDPEAGRFVSRDPVGLQGGLNSFAYAPNPLEYVDPVGLAFFSKKSRRHIEHRHVDKSKYKTKGNGKAVNTARRQSAPLPSRIGAASRPTDGWSTRRISTGPSVVIPKVQ